MLDLVLPILAVCDLYEAATSVQDTKLISYLESNFGCHEWENVAQVIDTYDYISPRKYSGFQTTIVINATLPKKGK